MILVTSAIGVLGMIVLPILLGFWLTRKFSLPWKLFFAGAVTFIASQVLHLPFLYGFTALFSSGILPSPPEAWATIFNAIFLGLAAGIFEETARWILFRFILKKARAWNEGVLVGAGHGGVEALLVGVLGILTVINMVVLRNADLAAMGVPAEQLELTKQQVTEFWNSPAYMGLMGFVERIFAVCLHVALSVMVLYSVTYRKPLWFWLAVLWHALVDAAAVYLLPLVGVTGVEIVVGALALVSLVILFRLRKVFEKRDTSDVQKAVQNGEPSSPLV